MKSNIFINITSLLISPNEIYDFIETALNGPALTDMERHRINSLGEDHLVNLYYDSDIKKWIDQNFSQQPEFSPDFYINDDFPNPSLTVSIGILCLSCDAALFKLKWM